jgi:ATP synthase F1 delta subunit
MSKIRPAVLAKAIFDVAAEQKNHEKWSLWLEKLALISQINEFMAIVNNPNIDQDVIIDLLSKVLENEDEQCLSLISLLYKHKVFKQCCALFEQYTKLLQNAQNSASIQVTSAYKLTKVDQNKILKQLKNVFSVEKIEANFDVDSTLISGFNAKWADKTYNASLKDKLDQIQHHLT